ncbi:hypothetical protein ACFLWX_03265 [Chloroflexota bacterium]
MSTKSKAKAEYTSGEIPEREEKTFKLLLTRYPDYGPIFRLAISKLGRLFIRLKSSVGKRFNKPIKNSRYG